MKYGKTPLTVWQILGMLIKSAWRNDDYLRIAFLKCDEKGCVHQEYHAEIAPEQIGKPCPRCGASLLTQEDFDKCRA